MRDNTISFISPSGKTIQAINEEGKPLLFCASDIASLQDYKAPRRAVDVAKKKGWCDGKRSFPTEGSKKRGVKTACVCTLDNAINITLVKPTATEDAKWFLNVVVPKARQINASKMLQDEDHQSDEDSVVEKIDAVIDALIALRDELAKR